MTMIYQGPGKVSTVTSALKLRSLMAPIMQQFLYHALIVEIEKTLPLTMEKPDTEWPNLVLMAATRVYSAIVTEEWFSPNVGVAVSVHRKFARLHIYGNDLLVKSEFESLIDDPSVGMLTPIKELQEEHQFQTLDDSLVAFVLSSTNLHRVISTGTEELKQTKQLYVKGPLFRRHEKLISILNKELG